MSDIGRTLTTFQRKLLEKSLDDNLRPEYSRRIRIMLLADDGYSQSVICQRLGCSNETARYWIRMAHLGNAHLWNDQPLGRPKVVNDTFCDRLQTLVTQNPQDYGYAFKRWTAHWLGRQLKQELGIEVSDRHILNLLKQMGLSTKPTTACPPEGASPDRLTIRDLAGDTPSAPLWLSPLGGGLP